MADSIALAAESGTAAARAQLRSPGRVSLCGRICLEGGRFHGSPQDARCTQAGGMGRGPASQADATPTQRSKIPPWKIR